MKSCIVVKERIWNPHAGQREFLESEAKVRVLACGRRWGKTQACAASIVQSMIGGQAMYDGRCTKDDVGIRRHIILAPTQDQANLLFDQVIELLEAELEANGEGFRAKGRRVRRSPYPRLDFEGHRVIARSGHLGRSLRGNEATDIVVDEAAYVPEKLISEVVFPMLATTNGTLTLISTPCGMNHFWRFFRMGQEATDRTPTPTLPRAAGEGASARTPHPVPASPTHSASSVQASPTRGEVIPGHLSIWSRQAPSWESPYVSADFLATQRELISERAFRVEYGAEFLDSVGRVFRTEAIDACLVAETPLPVRFSPTSPTGGEVIHSLDEKWASPPFIIGIDWARYADYTAVVVLSGDRKEARLVCAERFHGMAWPELVEGVAAICHRYSECLAICDATGIGDAVEGMLRKRLPWLKLKTKVFSNSFKAELADGLAWMLENGRFKMRPHPELIRELQHFEALPSASEGRWKFGAPEGFHDDLVVALGLACEILPSAGGVALAKAGKRRPSVDLFFSRDGEGGDSDVIRFAA